MSLADCKIEYDAPAVLHERVASGPIVSGVQVFRGGPIAEGSFAGMIKKGLALPQERAVNRKLTTSR